MFRELLCPSSGARDYDVDYHIGRYVLGSSSSSSSSSNSSSSSSSNW